jgi:senataxin
LLIKRLKDNIWKEEGPEFPQVVFDSVKDNRTFLELIENVDGSAEKPWFLGLFAEYLHSLSEHPSHGNVFAKTVDFLCERTQHERFKFARPLMMLTAIRVSNQNNLMKTKIRISIPLAVEFNV